VRVWVLVGSSFSSILGVEFEFWWNIDRSCVQISSPSSGPAFDRLGLGHVVMVKYQDPYLGPRVLGVILVRVIILGQNSIFGVTSLGWVGSQSRGLGWDMSRLPVSAGPILESVLV
uniref:Uncharacterized protein n=1 Tax=Cannabis sativa TaxID=3483 RepID=A0A803P590_CANSA